MAGQLLPQMLWTANDGGGNPISGATLTFYLTTTTTPATVYTDAALNTAAGLPQRTSDSAGRFDQIYLDPAVCYKAVLKDAAGVVIDTLDPVNQIAAASVGLFTSLGALAIPTGTDLIQTTGAYVKGKGAARYVSVAAGPATRYRVQTANGRWFELCEPIVSPEMMQARGDGATDDWLAWQGLIAFINAKGGGVVSCEPGATYFLNQYYDGSTPLVEAQWQSLDSITIFGNGAKVKSRGGFNRGTIAVGSALSLVFDQCANITIFSLEADGSNDTITKSVGVDETYRGYGMKFQGCHYIFLANCYTHHWITDGIVFTGSTGPGGNQLACTKAVVWNHRSLNNARQALSVVELVQGEFHNSDFSDTGLPSTYGSHSPSLGVDVEQDRLSDGTPAANSVDFDNSLLLFDNCRIENNTGGTIGTTFPGYTKKIIARNCVLTMNAAHDGLGTFGVQMDSTEVGFEDCEFNLAGRTFGMGITSNDAHRSYMRRCVVSGTSKLFASGSDFPCDVDDCTFICTRTTPHAANAKMIENTNAKLRFRGNTIIVPKEAYLPRTASDDSDPYVQLWFVREASGNRYETDLLAASGPFAGAAHFAVEYDGGVLVSNDTFVGQTAGVANTFRPARNSSFDTTYPYAWSSTLPVVSGSRAANAALADFLAEFAKRGWLTDSSVV